MQPLPATRENKGKGKAIDESNAAPEDASTAQASIGTLEGGGMPEGVLSLYATQRRRSEHSLLSLPHCPVPFRIDSHQVKQKK